jgi:hypothetical protein
VSLALLLFIITLFLVSRLRHTKFLISDFVNLSTNLVGLDESMLKIEDPLRRYSDRATEVRRSLQDALTALKTKLAEREALQAKRVALQVNKKYPVKENSVIGLLHLLEAVKMFVKVLKAIVFFN